MVIILSESLQIIIEGALSIFLQSGFDKLLVWLRIELPTLDRCAQCAFDLSATVTPEV